VAWLALAVVLVLAIVLFRLRGGSFQWQLFFATLRHVDWRWFALSILLMLLTYVGRALRWEVMLRPLGSKVSLWRLTSDTAIGFMAAVLLGRVGELVRPYLISLSARVSFSSQMAAWFLERILDLLAVLLILAFALASVPSRRLALGPGLRWMLGVGGYLVALLGSICLLLLLVFAYFPKLAEQRILGALAVLSPKYYEHSKSLLRHVSEGLKSTRTPSLFGLLLLYTVLEWGLITGGYYALLHGFSATASFKITDVVIMLGFVALGGLFQIPGIGGGVQVVSIVVLTEIYGLSLEAASGIAMLLWVLTLVIIVPVGLLCAFHQGLNFSKIKHLAVDQLSEQENQ
jgi:hypothetical protein